MAFFFFFYQFLLCVLLLCSLINFLVFKSPLFALSELLKPSEDVIFRFEMCRDSSLFLTELISHKTQLKHQHWLVCGNNN